MNRIEETTFRNGRLSLETEENEIVTETTAPATGSSLMSDGKTTRKISRAELSLIPVPPATNTFQPIAHRVLVDTLDDSLAFRRFQIVRSEFAVSSDGMKMFGLLEINAELDGIRFAIGLRNSNDKSMRLGLVAGYKVKICDNMMFQGDFNPLLAKHTKRLDLIEAVSAYSRDKCKNR